MANVPRCVKVSQLRHGTNSLLLQSVAVTATMANREQTVMCKNLWRES
jgi:hypothetical protein